MPSSGWRCRRGIQEAVNYHKVSLEKIRDRATAKKPVVGEKYRRNHSQGASGVANELVVKR